MTAAVTESWEDALDATDRFDEVEALLDAIRGLTKTHRRFSANDLPDHVRSKVNAQRVGIAFRRAVALGLIVNTRTLVASDKQSTHGKGVWLYEAAPRPVPEQPRDSDGRWTTTGPAVEQLSIDEVLA